MPPSTRKWRSVENPGFFDFTNGLKSEAIIFRTTVQHPCEKKENLDLAGLQTWERPSVHPFCAHGYHLPGGNLDGAFDLP